MGDDVDDEIAGDIIGVEDGGDVRVNGTDPEVVECEMDGKGDGWEHDTGVNVGERVERGGELRAVGAEAKLRAVEAEATAISVTTDAGSGELSRGLIWSACFLLGTPLDVVTT